MDNEVNQIMQNITSARIKKGISQRELAENIGVSKQAVSKWERGESLPDIYKIKRLAKELDISIEVLLGE